MRLARPESLVYRPTTPDAKFQNTVPMRMAPLFPYLFDTLISMSIILVPSNPKCKDLSRVFGLDQGLLAA